MDVRKKLVEILNGIIDGGFKWHSYSYESGEQLNNDEIASHLIDHGVTVQECGEWVHPKEYVVSNGFLCSKCGREEASYYPINPRSGGGCIADENGNFYYPPKLNYCPNCGAKMMP